MNELYSSYKNFKPAPSSAPLSFGEGLGVRSYDTIIIGSGISGMATGAILSKEGQRVLVLEQHYTPGGLTHTFKRNDYEWDVGVHYVGEVGNDSFMIKKVYDYVCDTPIIWADMGEVYECIYFGDEKFEFKKGRKPFTDYFINLFPEEKEGIEKYVELIIAMDKYGMGYFGEKVVPGFLAKILGKLMRKKYLKYASRTTKSILDELIKSDKLKAILTAQYGDIGLTPAQSSFAMHAGVARHYLEGGFYPVGGSGVFFEKIAPVITKAGGTILVRAEVSEILIENGRAKGVKMADGKTILAKTIISTAGIDITYRNLLPLKIQQEIGLPQLMEGLNNSTSGYCLYLGLKGSAAELNIPKSNFWIFPPQYDHDKNRNDYIKGITKDLPVVYISFPGAKDPDFEKRFPNKCTIEIIALESYDKFKPWESEKWKHRSEEYDKLKEKLSSELLEYLYKYLPQTKGKIDYQELSTPLSIKHFTKHNYGEMYGLAHTIERFNNLMLKPQTPIKGLYLAGQDIITAGVAGGLMSSVICVSHIKKTNYLNKIMKN
ncbi:MAG: phytoene desaturase family protein [Bacteroidia bacterium]